MYGTVIFKGVNQSEYHSLYIQSSLHINLNLLFFKKTLAMCCFKFQTGV